MTIKTPAFDTFDTGAHTEPLSAIGALLRGRFSDAVTAWKDAAAIRNLCSELAGLNDRMLLDIGVTPEEIARLRAGDRFLPGRYTA